MDIELGVSLDIEIGVSLDLEVVANQEEISEGEVLQMVGEICLVMDVDVI